MVDIVDPLLRPEANESRRCAFCNYKGKLTAEHIWPETIGKYIEVPGRPRHRRGTFSLPESVTTWEQKAFAATVHIDCNPCNHERLETIEREAIPYIVAMAFNPDDGGGLPLTARRKLAAFALRMFAVTQYTHQTVRPVPRSHREHLVSNHRAPPLITAVWLWRLAFDPGREFEPSIHGIPIRVARKGETLPAGNNAYHGLLRFGALVMEIASRIDGQPFPVSPVAPDAVIPIWPPDLGRVLSWPPKQVLSERDWQGRLDGLTESLYL